MLTVKFVAPDGEEIISEHLHVIADKTEHDGRPRVLVFDEMPDSSKCNHAGIYVAPDELNTQWLHRGIIFVMNRYGATVAKYLL
jgi:hypothetical protein